MEIKSEDGTKIPLNQSSRTEFGRGSGFNANDRTVSRRHVSFKLQCDKNQTHEESKFRVQFEVIGKNPMWVREGRTGEIRVFRRGDEGEMEVGDVFCVSGKIPVWFVLKRNGFEFENDFAERLESSFSDVSATGFEPVDVSEIDPVKDFGFLVMGHELDHYPKQMIRNFKNWDWFLEETRKNSDDDEEVEERKGTRRKRKNGGGGDDDWTGESEKDKELVSTSRKVQRPNYSTRSKHQGKPFKNSKSSKNSAQKSIRASKEENEDEDDETLGGFIVEDVELEEESDVAEDEEDNFDEDEDDDVDDNEEIDD